MLAARTAYPWAILGKGGRAVWGRRASLLLSLLLTAALLYLLPGLMGPVDAGDDNRMDERLRPARMRTLTVWLMPGGVDDRKLLGEACAAFEKEQPGVRVFLRTVTAEEWTAEDAVLPDVALLATGSLTIPEQVLLPLTGMGETAASGRSGGTDYAVPLWLEANVLSLPAEWTSSTPLTAPTQTPLPGLASPAPQETEDGWLAAEDLPWRRLLEPGALALPQGVALQQLLFLCPAQIRNELAALGRQEASEDAQAYVCTLGEHLSAVRGGEGRAACLLMPAVSDRVRYGERLYRCLQAHQAQAGWTPTAAVSLWAKVLTSETGEALPWAALGDCSRMVREMRFFAGSTERTVTSTMSPTERTSEGWRI